MNDYIDREAVLSKCQQIWSNADETTEVGVTIINIVSELTDFVENISSADVQLMKHGRWINRGDYSTCTVCGSSSGTQYDGVEPIPKLTPYCSNCGARMDGSVE